MKSTEIPRELFAAADRSTRVENLPPVPSYGYFGTAARRFLRFGTARIALGIIALIALFSIVVPITVPRSDSLMDPYYAKLPPRISWASDGMGVAHGALERRLGDEGLTRLIGIGIGAGDERYSPVLAVGEPDGRTRNVRIDSYLEVGFIYKTVTQEEYSKMLAWENESGERLLYPLIAINEYNPDPTDANVWYKADADGLAVSLAGGSERRLEVATDMPLEENYMKDTEGRVVYTIPSGGGGGSPTGYRVRLLYHNYYVYKNGMLPDYLLGTDSQGYDLALRVCGGIRVSLLLALAVSAVNFVIGALVGAAEGYYGGAVDLIVERITDVLSGVPFIVVATLFQIYLSDRVGAIPSLLFAFVLTGWLSTANRVRGQFFRYKNAEYVLAARTLGVSDARIIWRHIFPNTLGTLITASALVVPGVIFTESMLSFLGIVNLGAEGVTSLGTLLADASGIWVNYPHLMLVPALIISLLMIAFNMIGNSLRDAFNPSTGGGA